MTFKALLTRSLAGAARVAAGIFTVLVGFQLVLVAVAASYEEAHSFERMVQFVPGVFQRSLGGTLSAFATFKGLVTMGYFHPLVVITVTQFAIYLASEPAGEVENRLLDLLLARPLARHWIVTRSLALMTLGLVTLTLCMALATRTGLALWGPAGVEWPSGTTLLHLGANLVAVAWCFGAAALAVAAHVQRRASAMAAVGVSAVLLYFIDFIAIWWQPARLPAFLSPFHYYAGLDILSKSAAPWGDVALLAGAGTLFAALAYRGFARRDF